MHNRESERTRLARKLAHGVNIHMPAPRRIGKTWTINRLAEDLRKDGWLIVEVDVQGVSAPEDFAQLLCRKIQGQIPSLNSWKAALSKRVENFISGDWSSNPIEAIGQVKPEEFLDAVLAELASDDTRAAIFVDEIAYFVLAFAERSSSEAKNFFYRLRQLQSEYSNVRWLFTGSIGLPLVAERFGLGGAFVDLETFTLEPLNADEAKSFIMDSSTQQGFNHAFIASDEVLDHLFAELGWLSPFYLNLVGNEVTPSGKAVDGTLTATHADLEEAFDKLLKPSRKMEFSIWPEHINKNLPKSDQELARKILDSLSQIADGEGLDTIYAAMAPAKIKAIRDVLNILENDGLLACVQERYRFRSDLVRRYWKEYEAK